MINQFFNKYKNTIFKVLAAIVILFILCFAYFHEPKQKKFTEPVVTFGEIENPEITIRRVDVMEVENGGIYNLWYERSTDDEALRQEILRLLDDAYLVPHEAVAEEDYGDTGFYPNAHHDIAIVNVPYGDISYEIQFARNYAENGGDTPLALMLSTITEDKEQEHFIWYLSAKPAEYERLFTLLWEYDGGDIINTNDLSSYIQTPVWDKNNEFIIKYVWEQRR